MAFLAQHLKINDDEYNSNTKKINLDTYQILGLNTCIKLHHLIHNDV